MKNLQINIGDRIYSGSWHVEGKEVCVHSAYGSRRKLVGRRQPKLVAEDALQEILATQTRH